MSAAYLESLFGLSGKTAVVIGGNGVLGGALGEGIARAGAYVVLAGRDAARGEERAAAIRQAGGQAAFLPVNVAERASQEALLEHVVAERGGVELLVNCAGVNSASSYFEATDEAWERVLNINLRGTHLGCQIFGRHMADSGRGGAILNIGSVTADVPLSRVFAYSASKAAVVNLTKNVARELAPFGVRVNVLCPGFFPAEQNRKILDEKRVAGIMAGTPMARFGQPEELVGAALLLLSPAAGSFITGAEVYVDGGFTANRF
ncbi:MAG: SDR family oxidoreductase [Pirellulales bacterium]